MAVQWVTPLLLAGQLVPLRASRVLQPVMRALRGGVFTETLPPSRLGNIVGAGLCPTVVAALVGPLGQKRGSRSGTRMGQHDDRGVLGEARFPRMASGMLTWPQVNMR